LPERSLEKASLKPGIGNACTATLICLKTQQQLITLNLSSKAENLQEITWELVAQGAMQIKVLV
jgi:hypothetical protein